MLEAQSLFIQLILSFLALFFITRMFFFFKRTFLRIESKENIPIQPIFLWLPQAELPGSCRILLLYKYINKYINYFCKVAICTYLSPLRGNVFQWRGTLGYCYYVWMGSSACERSDIIMSTHECIVMGPNKNR